MLHALTRENVKASIAGPNRRSPFYPHRPRSFTQNRRVYKVVNNYGEKTLSSQV